MRMASAAGGEALRCPVRRSGGPAGVRVAEPYEVAGRPLRSDGSVPSGWSSAGGVGLSCSGAGAAVDRQDRAGHVRGAVAEQPCGRLGDLPGVATSQVSIISVAAPPGVMPLTRIRSPAQFTAAVSVRLLSARFMAP